MKTIIILLALLLYPLIANAQFIGYTVDEVLAIITDKEEVTFEVKKGPELGSYFLDLRYKNIERVEEYYFIRQHDNFLDDLVFVQTIKYPISMDEYIMNEVYSQNVIFSDPDTWFDFTYNSPGLENTVLRFEAYRIDEDFRIVIKIEYFEDTAEDFHRKAEGMTLQEEYSRALNYINSAIDLDPKNSDMLKLRGIINRQTEDYDDAIANFDEALRYNPDDYELFYYRGFTYGLMGNNCKAIEDYTRALTINPDYIDGYIDRALVRHNNMDYKGSIEDFTKAIDIDPDNEKYYSSRGFSKILDGDYESAVEDYNKCIELNPNNDNNYNSRGVAHYYNGDNELALADYEKAIEITSDQPQPYYNIGNVKYSQELYFEAINYYNKAIELNPVAGYYYNRGNAKNKMMDIDGACLDWSKALELDHPHDQDLLNLLNEHCH